MYFVLFVLHDTTKLHEILDAWKNAGVTGITVLPSSGFKRLMQSDALRDDLPLIFDIEDLMQHEEKLNRTLFTIVETEALADRVLDVTQEIVGDLNLPNTGVLAIIPVSRAYGLNRKKSDEDSGN